MSPIEWYSTTVAILISVVVGFVKLLKKPTPPVMPSTDHSLLVVPVVPIAPIPPSSPSIPVQNTFDTPKQAFHAVRVICDNLGLTVVEKNTICACIYQESQFNNEAIDHNKDKQGNILSTDWGLCQINDWYHIGAGKDFPTVAYVLDNPDQVVEWMIGMYKHGLLKQWVSYSSGAYAHWLSTGSPMWLLAS